MDAGIHVPTTGTIGQSELEALTLGACAYSSGGGGSILEGQALAAELAERMGDLAIPLVSLEALPDEATVAVPAAYPRPRALPSIDSAAMAYRALGRRGGPPFHAVLPGSLGVLDLLVALGVALECGIPIVDASGGARPGSRMTMTSWAAGGVLPGRMIFADGSETVAVDTDSVTGADRAARSVIAGDALSGPIGGASWAMLGTTARRASVAEALSSACDLGTQVMTARADGLEPVERYIAALDGAVVIAHGRVERVVVALNDRHDHVEVEISTPGGMVDVLALDTYLEVRRGESAVVSAPDLIMVIRSDGTPYTPRDLSRPEVEGTRVAVVAVPVPALFDAPIVLDAVADLRRRVGGGTEWVPFPEASA